MKILYQSRVDIFDKRGGDTEQIEYTKKYIEEKNPSIKIDIKPTVGEESIAEYDLVHLFNLDWVCETYPQAKWAKMHNKPIVLSSIHHSENEVLRYEKEERYDIRRIYNFFIPWQSTRDLWKNIYRSLKDRRKLFPTIEQFIVGIRKQQAQIVAISDVVLVQTDIEAEEIKKDFKTKDFKWEKVVNGVNTELFYNSTPHDFKELMRKEYGKCPSNILISVGRVEPRKNWLKVIEAFEMIQKESSDFKKWRLVFIGSYNPNQYEYKWRFNKKVKENKNIIYLGRQSQEIVASAMAMPGVFINPSWFETTGLVALEAAVAGMRPIVTGNRIREYLGEEAVYCDPGDVVTIKNAILKASRMDRIDEKFKQQVIGHYSWENTAKETVKVYNTVLKK